MSESGRSSTRSATRSSEKYSRAPGGSSSLIESLRTSDGRSNTVASMFSLGDGLGGGKTIGWVGSLCLLVNNITVPAMLSIGTVFAQAGWVPSVLLFVLCGVLACFASVFLRLAIESRRPFKGLSQEPACSKWHVPGNGDAIAKVAQTSSAAGIGAAICAVHQAGQGRAQRLIESSGTEGIAAQQLVAMTQNPRQSDELHASPGR